MRAPDEASESPNEDIPRLYRSRAAAGVHETMQGLDALGFLPPGELAALERTTLIPVENFPVPDIAALREREGVTQAVLAAYLGVAVGTVSQWERGLRRPDGPVIKLLSLIERHGLEHIR